MKLWIDDERDAPEGFVHARTYDEALALIKEAVHARTLESVWFDHDLGDPDPVRTGYLLAKWLEAAAYGGGLDWFTGEFGCQSSNPRGRADIVAACKSIGSAIGRRVI